MQDDSPMLKRLTRFISKPARSAAPSKPPEPVKLPRSAHPVSRSEIPHGALSVLKRLHDKGFEAYLVGGCIRDRMLGKNPKDFDVATNATPEEVDQLFRNARIIGRRFRIVHVRFGRDIIEVTTFRGQAETPDSPHHQQSADGMLIRDNVWGSIEDDALRRDFTINALYYSAQDLCVYDFTGGLKDLKKRQLRLIGDPAERYREDPVRMLRALRFAAKLDFTIEKKTAKAIHTQASTLSQVAPARLFDEVLKLFLGGAALKTFCLIRDYGLFTSLFPATQEALEQNPEALALLEQAMINTDRRIQENRPVTPAFLYAVLLWPAVNRLYQQLIAEGVPPIPALQQAATSQLHRQVQRIAIPKRFSLPMREIWEFQLKLPRRHGQRAWDLVQHPRFRAAYDFLLLREDAGEPTEGLAAWWTSFQEADENQQQLMVQQLKAPPRKKTKPRRRRGRKPRAESGNE